MLVRDVQSILDPVRKDGILAASKGEDEDNYLPLSPSL